MCPVLTVNCNRHYEAVRSEAKAVDDKKLTFFCLVYCVCFF